MYKIENDKTIALTASYKHPSISNYHLLPKDDLLADGWIDGDPPVVEVEPIAYRETQRNILEAESKLSSFAFKCEVGGQVLEFDISDTDRIDVLGQLAMGQTEIEIHDVRRQKSSYTAEEAGIVMATLAAVTRAYKYPYDAKIKALYELTEGFTREDVDTIVNS